MVPGSLGRWRWPGRKSWPRRGRRPGRGTRPPPSVEATDRRCSERSRAPRMRYAHVRGAPHGTRHDVWQHGLRHGDGRDVMSERDDHADPADLAEQAAPLRDDEDPDDLDDLVVDTSDPEVDDA